MNLKQLAQELNLSISTVSKALRDSHEISSGTKKIVVDKARELNYQVNPFASGLRKQKSKTIAVVIPEVVNDFFGPVINGIESIAQEKGYHVLIYLTHEDMQKEVSIIRLLQNGRVDGILMSLSEQTSNTSHLEDLKGMPLVFFDRVAEHINVPKVTTDDCNSGYKATEHLISNGCRKIAFLSTSPNLSISRKRMTGYLEALRKHKMATDNNLIVSCSGDHEKNKQTIRKLLKRKNRPEAIFASVEKLALATYEVSEEFKLEIPNDLKVICFSNSQNAALLNPSLTTITQPAYEIGREAATILFKLVEKKGHFLAQTILDSTLIERNSTRASRHSK